MAEFNTNVSAGKVWSDGFTGAATKLRLPIQYSMATPTNLLQSLSQPSVTNFRVSGDFADGGSWDVGWSSMLVWALGAAPSKDTFWTSNQSDVAKALAPECKSGCPPDHSDAGCELHSMLAVMSTGPVQPSDSVGRTRKDLLLPCMRGDGLLLPPSKPLTVVDRLMDVAHDPFPSAVETQCCRAAQRREYYKKGGGAVSGGPCAWELCAPWGTTVLSTFSGQALPGPPAEAPNLNELQYAWYFLAHSLAGSPFAVRSGDFWPPIHFEEGSVDLVYREWHQPRCAHGARADTCSRRVSVASSTSVDKLFEVGDPSLPVFAPRLVVAVPVLGGFALLGELDKYVSVSRRRFLDVDRTAGSELRVTIQGSAKEEVVVTCLVPDAQGRPAAVVSRKVVAFEDEGNQTVAFTRTTEPTRTTSLKTDERVFYSMPETIDLRKASRDNATGALFDTTLCSVWRLTQPHQALRPVTRWDAGQWTGHDVSISPGTIPAGSQMGVDPATTGSSAIQYSQGTFGALLNMFESPIVSANLGTLTIEYTPSQPNWIYVWQDDANASIHVSFDYQVPFGNKTWADHALGGQAIYSTLALGLHHVSGESPQFIWYEVGIFDLGRSMQPAVFVDTISGEGIVHGTLGPTSDGRYNSQSPSSADSSNQTFRGFRHFEFDVNADHLRAGISDINSRFNFSLSQNVSQWALGHFNMELESNCESSCMAAHSLRNLRITVQGGSAKAPLKSDESGPPIKVVPTPQRWLDLGGTPIRITASSVILANLSDSASNSTAVSLQLSLSRCCSLQLPVHTIPAAGPPPGDFIALGSREDSAMEAFLQRLSHGARWPETENSEGYSVTVDSHSPNGQPQILLLANSPAGVFYSTRTLVQLVNGSRDHAVSRCRIDDWPDSHVRGYYMWEEQTNDVGKYWPWIVNLVDTMADHKMNLALYHSEEFFVLDSAGPDGRPWREVLQGVAALFPPRFIEFIPELQTGGGGGLTSVNPNINEGLFVQNEPFTVGSDGFLHPKTEPLTGKPLNGDLSVLNSSATGRAMPAHWKCCRVWVGDACAEEERDPGHCHIQEETDLWEGAPRNARAINVSMVPPLNASESSYSRGGLISEWFDLDGGPGFYYFSAHYKLAQECDGEPPEVILAGQSEGGAGYELPQTCSSTNRVDWCQMGSTMVAKDAQKAAIIVRIHGSGNCSLLVGGFSVLRMNSALTNIIRTNATDVRVAGLERGKDFTVVDPDPRKCHSGGQFTVGCNNGFDCDLVAMYGQRNNTAGRYQIRLHGEVASLADKDFLVSFDFLPSNVNEGSFDHHPSCFAEPLWADLLCAAVNDTMQSFGATQMMFSFDEIWGMNRDSRSQALNLTNGESLARAINIVQNCMVTAAGGEKDVHAWVWDDMVNPYHTGGRDYEQASCECATSVHQSQIAKATLPYRWWQTWEH